jgi:hypothetical protein
MKILHIKCECGQVTHLEKNDETGEYCYAFDPHGCDSPQKGCFNCRKPLDHPELTVKKAPDEVAPEEDAPDEDTPIEDASDEVAPEEDAPDEKDKATSKRRRRK